MMRYAGANSILQSIILVHSFSEITSIYEIGFYTIAALQFLLAIATSTNIIKYENPRHPPHKSESINMSQSKINLTILKRYLKTRSQEELIGDIAELFKRFEAVKDFYQIQLYPEEQKQVAERYKKIIENEFFPTRGFGRAKLSVAKKAITEYKKVNQSSVGLIDMMLFYVEQGVKFTRAYGDIDEPFYNSMESMYEKAIKNVIKYKQEETFQKRCYKIVSDTSGMGWGFHDALSHMYEEAFQQF